MKKMRQRKTIVIGILAATAVLLAGLAGYAIAYPYMSQGNTTNNGGSNCSGEMMANHGMGGMIGSTTGTSSYMGGYGGTNCPYHSNGQTIPTNTPS